MIFDLFGETHAYHKNQCRLRNPQSIGKFLEWQIRSTLDPVDLFLETSYLPFDQFRWIESDISYISSVHNRFLSCTIGARQLRKVPCLFPNLRMHQSDQRTYLPEGDLAWQWKRIAARGEKNPEQVNEWLLDDELLESGSTPDELFKFFTRETSSCTQDSETTSAHQRCASGSGAEKIYPRKSFGLLFPNSSLVETFANSWNCCCQRKIYMFLSSLLRRPYISWIFICWPAC